MKGLEEIDSHITSIRSTSHLSSRILTDSKEIKRFDQYLDQQHELGSRRPKGRSARQVIEQEGQWVALILWSASVWHLQDRDQWIGWDRVMRSERLQLIVNQSRFLVLEATRRPNLASQCLAVSVRQLPEQWTQRFGYRPLLAETFTNPESHEGTCYKAAGWEAVGMSSKEPRHRCDLLPGHKRPKRIWLKALHPDARQQLLAPKLSEPYAKALSAHNGQRCVLTASLRRSLYETLQQVPDKRKRQGQRYPLGAILSIVCLGLLRGAVHLSTIHRTAQKLDQRQRGELGLRFKRGTRFRAVPGYDVYREVLKTLDLEKLAQVLTQWLQSHDQQLPRTLAVDGKTIRDHLGLIISLVDVEEGAVVALRANTQGKGHELKETQKLLADPQVNLVNAVVTADSLHCQTKTAQIIVTQKGGDYVLQVRDNQPTLRQRCEQQLQEIVPLLPNGMSRADAKNYVNSVADPSIR
jgi:hypothetical protein